MIKENLNIPEIVNTEGCFDLQFRKDVRHKRTGSPTYYRWKIEFAVTGPINKSGVLEKIGQTLKCGKLTKSAGQARYSVQKIEDLNETVIPYFNKNQLAGKKKNDFNLWQKAVKIIYNNSGKPLLSWKKSDFLQILEIHKSAQKHKLKPRTAKWAKDAQEFVKNLK